MLKRLAAWRVGLGTRSSERAPNNSRRVLFFALRNEYSSANIVDYGVKSAFLPHHPQENIGKREATPNILVVYSKKHGL